jgi:hypothetical protein
MELCLCRLWQGIDGSIAGNLGNTKGFGLVEEVLRI